MQLCRFFNFQLFFNSSKVFNFFPCFFLFFRNFENLLEEISILIQIVLYNLEKEKIQANYRQAFSSRFQLSSFWIFYLHFSLFASKYLHERNLTVEFSSTLNGAMGSVTLAIRSNINIVFGDYQVVYVYCLI